MTSNQCLKCGQENDSGSLSLICPKCRERIDASLRKYVLWFTGGLFLLFLAYIVFSDGQERAAGSGSSGSGVKAEVAPAEIIPLVYSEDDLRRVLIGKTFCDKLPGLIVRWSLIDVDTYIMDSRDVTEENFSDPIKDRWEVKRERSPISGRTQFIADLGRGYIKKNIGDPVYPLTLSHANGWAHTPCTQEDLVRPP